MQAKINILLLSIAVCLVSGCENEKLDTLVITDLGDGATQESIDRIELMPNIPSPYKMLDWEQKARDFDAYVFNESTNVYGKALIWYDNTRRNIDQETFGLYTALNDGRQGPDVNVEGHEALTGLSALLGASLIGIDKSNQNGRNYVKMVQNYFNCDNGWNVIMNNTDGSGTQDWWYIVFPNVLYYALSELYPDTEGAEDILRTVADQFYTATITLEYNYSYSYFNYKEMKGYVTSSIPFQQDAAGGHAWVLYAAYKHFGDEKYLSAARMAMDALVGQSESRFYEVLLPIGALTAARLNAEQGNRYDVKKIIDWVFDGCTSSTGRYGWGVIAQTWGDYDVYGLQGSNTDGGGYAFFMNSVKLTWPIVPIAKYEPQFARAIGKWMLNTANACRLFYPTEIDDDHQWLPELKDITNGIIAYEGLRKGDKYGKTSLMGKSPVALGDGPQWSSANGEETMFSLYSTAPVGILGAVVKTTDVDCILRIDCNVTDFYAERRYPVYLYYNPYGTDEEITYNTSSSADLFDIVSKTYLATGVDGSAKITVPADAAVLVVELPANSVLESVDGKIVVTSDENTIISY